ncbi:MAG TPA: D-arabinono-1,4-lactone oxidase [Mycobacteriales bacterium]|nr:D-arabinono-1,4-lactone oxidase [Mycobacteriales bacterium]
MGSDRAWRNWAGNQAMAPARVERPASTDEVSDAVRRAAAEGLRVKAVGSGHSFTGIALTDGLLLDLSRLDRLLRVERETCRVTVQAGMPLHRLNATLAAHGLGLTNMGDIDRQTVAGALSTGTHGTGRRSGGLAAQVAGLELVLADGSVTRCSPDERPELFAGARLGLGALGLLTAVTLQAEPAFLLRAVERPEPLDAVLGGFEHLVAAHDHAEFYWFPHTRTALVKRNDRVEGPPQPLSRLRSVLEDEVLTNGVFTATCRLGRAAPRVVPAVNRLASRALSERTYSDVAPNVFTSPRRVRFRETEWAVPRHLLPDLFGELRTLPERLGLRISFPVEVRVCPADDVPLSTAFGRDSAYVAAHAYVGTPHEAWFRAVGDLAASAGGRPHWGKEHDLAAEDLRPRYPRFDAFVGLRDEVDPERRFANAYLDRVLGP